MRRRRIAGACGLGVDLLGMGFLSGSLYSAMRFDPIGAADIIEYYGAISNEIKGEVTHLDHDLHYTRRSGFRCHHHSPCALR